MFKELNYVYAVYKEKSFTKAAQKMFLSQPALSAMVKKAEQRIGKPIFDRSSSPLKLTDAGKYYIQQAERIMKIQRETEEYFHLVSDNGKNQLRLGGSAFFQAYIFPPIISAFRALHPDVSVSWIEARNKMLVEKLTEKELDFFPEVDYLFSDSITGEIWDYEHIILAVPWDWEINDFLSSFRLNAADISKQKHINPQTPAVDLSAFSDQSFILLREGNDSFHRAIEMCSNAGFTPKRVSMTADQMLTAYYLAASGEGIVFMRDSIIKSSEMANSLYYYKISDPLASRPVYIYHRRDAVFSPTAAAFLEHVVHCRDDSN